MPTPTVTSTVPAYLGLDIQPTQGLTPDTEYNLIMDWQLWSGAGSDLALQLSAAYRDETVSINSVPGNYGDGANPIPVNRSASQPRPYFG